MNYATIKPLDIANGPGVRVSLFVSGCRNKCPGCFNPETWDFNYGQEFTWDTLHEIEMLLKDPNVSGLSILGGDPFEPENRQWIETLCAYVKHNIDKPIWVWSGYSFEDLKNLPVMSYIDVLIDGRFEESLKDLRLMYMGSSNQRIIDVQKSISCSSIIRFRDDRKRGDNLFQEQERISLVDNLEN